MVDHVGRAIGRTPRAADLEVPVLNGLDRATTDRQIGAAELRLLDENTILSRHVLDWLMREGLLSRRTGADMDDEFRMTADRHGFSISQSSGA